MQKPLLKSFLLFSIALILSITLPVRAAEKISEPGKYEGYSFPEYAGVESSSFYLTMRDGVKIAVDLYLPKGLDPEAKLPGADKDHFPLMKTDPPPSLDFYRSTEYCVVHRSTGGGVAWRARPSSRETGMRSAPAGMTQNNR